MGELLGGVFGAWLWASLVEWVGRKTVKSTRVGGTVFGLLSAPVFALVMRTLVLDALPETASAGTPAQLSVVWGIGALLVAWPMLARERRLDAAAAQAGG